MVKNEIQQREGLLLPMPKGRIAVLSSASNREEIQTLSIHVYIQSMHFRSVSSIVVDQLNS